MRKLFLSIVFTLFYTSVVMAEVGFGARVGTNISSISSASDILKKEAENGFFIGPTVRLDLPMGFAFDISALYDQRYLDIIDGDMTDEDSQLRHITKRDIVFGADIRKNFGMSRLASFFIFTGPQINCHIGNTHIKDLHKYDWKWEESSFSMNAGIGLLLFRRIELKANYNVECGSSADITLKSILENTNDNIKSPRNNAWQISLAIYF